MTMARDEQRHREADTGKHATASRHAPVEARRPKGDARAHRQPAEADDAEGLPERQPEEYGGCDRIPQICGGYRYAGIGERGQRQLTNPTQGCSMISSRLRPIR